VSKSASSKKTFNAKIRAIGPSGAWSEMQIPFSVEKEWGIRARVSVRGTIGGFAFRSSIFPDGKGGHTMMVNKAMKENGGAIPGKTVRVELQQDTAPRTITVPKDFKRALAKNSKAGAVFEAFALSHRRSYVDWITQAKREETRTARITKAIEMIAAGKKRM
jgi:Bacteriocin-protection, YdeI or OmpD-Associated/Domain of unknown function (DUF1905)